MKVSLWTPPVINWRLAKPSMTGCAMLWQVTIFFLRPAGIIASDGTNEQVIAKLDLTVEGKIDTQDSSRLIFAGAYGPDIDLELQVQAGGYNFSACSSVSCVPSMWVVW